MDLGCVQIRLDLCDLMEVMLASAEVGLNGVRRWWRWLERALDVTEVRERPLAHLKPPVYSSARIEAQDQWC